MVREWILPDANSGDHRQWWNGKDQSGRSVSSGIYVSRLRQGGESVADKIVLVR